MKVVRIRSEGYKVTLGASGSGMGSLPCPSLQAPGEGILEEENLRRGWAAEFFTGHKELRDGTAGLIAAQNLIGHLLPLYQTLLPYCGSFWVYASTCLCPLNCHLTTIPSIGGLCWTKGVCGI